jgi:hypothetical protein
VATLSWFGTQYWLLGDTLAGRKFTLQPAQKGEKFSLNLQVQTQLSR